MVTMTPKKSPYQGTAKCIVSYVDGTLCNKPIRWASSLCPACETWSRRHGDADPNGRNPVHKLSVEQVIARIENLPVDDNGCRMGDGLYATDKNGYPQLKSGGAMWRACRFVLTHKLGRAIGEDLQACHTCDQPACLSADHLWEGSCSENRMDASRKGRLHDGYGHHRALRKLQEWQVLEIRKRYRDGGTSYAKLAAEYGVQAEAVRKVVLRINWKWLD